MSSFRPPRLPPRYTVGGVSVNDQQLEARARMRRAQAAERAAQLLPLTGSEQVSTNSRSCRTERRMHRASGDEADISEKDEEADIASLMDRIRNFRTDDDNSPATDAIRKNLHSGNDLSIMASTDSYQGGQGIIRTAVAEACGFTRGKSVGNSIQYSQLPAPPSNPEIDEPSLTNFTFAWSKHPSHRYNRTASFLLAERIVNDEDNFRLLDPDQPGVLQMVAQQIRVHLRYLSTVWNKQQYDKTLKSEDERETEAVRCSIIKQAHAADHRRRLLLDRRGATAAYYARPEWIAILNHVGAASMSSDDLLSDEDPSNPFAAGQAVYYITQKSWRSVEFLEFLRLLDRLSDIVEKRTKNIGRSFRIRKPVPSDKPSRESARSPNQNLNREYYTPSHQESLGKYHRYRTVAVNLEAALVDIRGVAENEGVMV